MPILFDPFPLRSLVLKNRFVVSPMCQYSSEAGFSNDWHLAHLGSFAVGGAALVLTEAAAVSPEGRISPDDLGIWDDAHTGGLKRITEFIAGQGAVPGIQLAHAGRKASTPAPWKPQGYLPPERGGWLPVAPSPVPYREGDPAPEALDAEGIGKVIADFRRAAARAHKAGFRVVEIHAAHGYLLNQALSPLSNRRTDAWGGSFENRTRLLLEVVAAVREVWPEELPLFVRISATEWAEGGWTLEDSVALAALLKAAGVDLVDCSSGGNVPKAKIPVGPLYQAHLAKGVREGAGIATGAVGLITTATECSEVLENGSADLVFLARQLLRDPHFPLRAAAELGVKVAWPEQYERAAWK